MEPRYRNVEERDRSVIRGLLEQHWGSVRLISRGRLRDASALEGFVAEVEGRILGLALFEPRDAELEVVALLSLVENRGIGNALLDRAVERAREGGFRRAWLITTNDNLRALRFYQKRGWRLVALHAGAMDSARSLKPEIPAVGADGIPIRDEFELEFRP